MSTRRSSKDQPHRLRRRGGSDFTSAFVAPSYPKVEQPPGVEPRSVVCPECKADVDQPCVSTTGERKKTVHVCRRRMAVRARNLRGDHVMIAYAMSMLPSERRQVRIDAGLTLDELARQLDVAAWSLGPAETGKHRPVRAWGARYGAWLKAQVESKENSK